MIAFDGGIALSMADFTRNCKTQKAQMVGQLAGAPVMTAFIAFVGICGTAGASLAFHEAIWEPAVLVSKFDNPAIVIIFSLFIIMAVLTTNVAANLVPPTNVLATLFAKKISYKKAALIAAVLALFAQPWNALASAYDLIYNVCGLLGALLGPISGLYLVSYLLEHKTHVDMVDLYREDGGRYYYKGGWNTAIIAIFLAATAVIIAGKYITPLNFLFDNAYVIGSVGAGLLYYIYLKIQNKRNGVNENDEDNHQTRHDCVTE
ncbi:MAG: cytosine permease [Enterocloster clostridioformis]